MHGAHQPLALVRALRPHVLSAFVHEADIERGVDSVLHVDNVPMRVVAARQRHSGVGRYLQVELVENAFAFVHLAKLLVKVLSYVELGHRLLVVANIPNVDAQIVAREDVAVI